MRQPDEVPRAPAARVTNAAEAHERVGAGPRDAQAVDAMDQLPIYLDNHATTRVDPRVLEVMLPFLGDDYGNAASRTHAFGWRAAKAVERAREQVAGLIGAAGKDLVFTSGATESNNLAVKGVLDRHGRNTAHVITVATEHKSVLDACGTLEQRGVSVTYLPVATDGRITREAIADAIRPTTVLISVMAANNEIGVVQPLSEIAEIARARDIVFHTDAAQAAGKVPFDVDSVGADLVSLTAHKMHGPKGIGALFVRRGARRRLAPLLDGGGQEGGLRSGTLNVPGIVGFGAAAALCAAAMPSEAQELARLRDRLLEGLQRRLTGVGVNGSWEHRLPNNLNVSVAHVDGEALQMGLDDVAISSSSACMAAHRKPSHVLEALGVRPELARASIRFGLSRFTTEAEIDYVVEKVTTVVNRLRALSPLHEFAEADLETLPASAWRL